jgi:hypothetical protein
MQAVFTCRFLEEKEEQRVGKNTSHGILEGNHCLAMFFYEERGMCAYKIGL